MQLISMTDFVLSNNGKLSPGTHYNNIVKYANFLKKPLKLGMFVPCDDYGNVLKKPVIYYDKTALDLLDGLALKIALEVNEQVNAYEQAKERVLFEGIKPHLVSGVLFLYEHYVYYSNGEICENNDGRSLETIEDLIQYADLTLTKSATKQFL